MKFLATVAVAITLGVWVVPASAIGTEAQRNCFAAAAMVEAVSKQAKGSVARSDLSQAQSALRRWGMSVARNDPSTNVFTLRGKLRKAVEPLVVARMTKERSSWGGSPTSAQAKALLSDLKGEMGQCNSLF